MSGFGTVPFGTGPAGLSVPITANAPASGPAGVRWINPASGDYEQDSVSGQLKQMPALRQQVLLALRTVYGSSTALPKFGVKAPRKMGDSFELEMRSAVRSALTHLTTPGLMRIDAIKVERGLGGRARITVSFTDNATGKADTVSTFTN